MNPDTKRLHCVAAQICSLPQQAEQQSRSPDSLHQLIGEIPGIQQTCRLLRKCMYRQWHHAAKLKRNELIRRLAYLGSIVTRLTADLTVRTNPQPSARAIQAELHEAENEFGEVRFDKRSKTLSVTTEHITLEGLELGRFEIRLNPTAVAANDGLDVLEAVALDPNPCSIDELITHPHVNDG
ncbi:MAG: hypothetical protein KDA71_22465, partial [Planctomycetales bacterium]|nr:hypothetical protein [Planctomycetales bacterium]